MTNPNMSRVISLLAQWEHRQEAGELESLEELCKESPELLEQVKAHWELLQGFPAPESQTKLFAPNQMVDDSNRSILSKAIAGVVIAGRYQLTQLIGEGGMGSVWRAEQLQPVKRQVALKLIRTHSGHVPVKVIRRFEAERQALALMDHANIAKIYDGGITEWGDPYFVMELVPGIPLTQFCDEKRLNVKQRLELFVGICQAVQHAHQKGIIHRDLKPGNILVAENDGKPVPRVIDFGVAKATKQKLTEETIHDFGTVVGTLAYMSPEQADAGVEDIDTRTDVYALGVILFELMTGSTPFDTRHYQKMALRDLLRLISDEEPPRLADKVSSAENLPNLAATRSTEPAQLTKAVQGDLEWIVLKALEKDRTRRYETASGFAADVERHLAGEAVLAHPPSRWYLVKKFVKRNRMQVVAAVLLATALVAGIIGTSIGFFQAKEAALKEKAANDLTKERLAQIEMINNSVFDIFSDFDIHKVKQDTEPVEHVLSQRLIEAGSKLDSKAIHDPLVMAYLQNRLGQTLLSLGEPKDAVKFLKRSMEVRKDKLGLNHPDTLTNMNNLALGYQNAGRFDLALPLSEETFRLMKARLGPIHPETLTSMNNLGLCYVNVGKFDQALPLYEETLKLRRANLGQDHPDTLKCMNNLAYGYRAAGKIDQALPLYDETFKLRKVKLGHKHPDTLTSMNNLAFCYQEAGKLNEALPIYLETFKLRKERLGTDHPDTLSTMNNLALGYIATGKSELALPLLDESLRLTKAKLGHDHPDTLISMNNLAACYQKMQEFEKAVPILKEVLDLLLSKVGKNHSTTLKCMTNLAASYHAAARYDLSLPLMEEVHQVFMAKYGPDHPDTLNSMENLAATYHYTGKRDQALLLFQEIVRRRKRKLESDHPALLNSMNNLASYYRDVGEFNLAIPIYEETLRLRKSKHGPSHPDTLTTMGNLGGVYCDANLIEKAVPVLKDFIDGQRKRYSKDHKVFSNVLVQVSIALVKHGQYVTAEEMLHEALEIRNKIDSDDWSTSNTLSLLGGTLLGQKKYEDAEPILIKSYEGLKKREKTIPPQARVFQSEALDRLIQLYTETNKPDEVKKWQAEKAKLVSQLSKKKN